MMESFWGTMQLELLDSRTWNSRAELANAIFEWIECWYNPKRRHSSIGMLSPVDYEQPTGPQTKITDPTPSVSGPGGQPQWIAGPGSPQLSVQCDYLCNL